MSIKQNGGVFGRNPTFNDVTIEGQLTFDGDIDINSDLKINGALEVDGGDVTISAGNLVIGTSGKGIDFSATAGTGTSELFDDYEEGTWTPTLIGSTSGSATLTVTSSSYVKVGSLVTASAYLSAIDLNADDIVGNMYIDGLPFSVGTSNLQGVSITYQSLSTTFPVISGRIVSSTIRLNQNTRNISLARSDSTAGTGAAIMISATYRA